MEIVKIDTQDGLGIIDVAVGDNIASIRLREYLKAADIALDAEAARWEEELHNRQFRRIKETD